VVAEEAAGEAATSSTRARRGRRKGHKEVGRLRWAGGAIEREEGGRLHSGTTEMSVGEHPDTVESAEVARWSLVHSRGVAMIFLRDCVIGKSSGESSGQVDKIR
jgi:hypothetical protein